jgi:hypothetical protein
VKKKILIVVNVLVILGLAAFGGLYFKKYRDLKHNPASASQVAQEQADKTIEEVGHYYDLPKDEKPSVATVSDKEKLKDQPFFAKAENGDVTLIYSNAKLAILYRPSAKKVINVSSVTIQGNVRVKVIGTATARQAAIAALNGAQISSTDGGDAKSAPTAVTVVDVTGKNADQAKTVAATVKGTVGSLPTGEDTPTDADILVVAGP